MIMINMNCPRCSVHGRVPKTLVNVRLTCKKCQEPFHLNGEGIAIAGDPPPPPGSENVVDEAALTDPGVIVDRWIAKIATVAKFCAKVAAAAVVLVALSFLYSNFKPNSLDGRGNEAGEAILKDDLPKFNTFASTETGIDLFEWYGFMRPKLDEIRRRVPENEMSFVARIKGQDSETKSAEMILRFGARNDIDGHREITSDEELTGQAKRYLDVRTIWTSDGWGRWWIDGSKTLRGPS